MKRIYILLFALAFLLLAQSRIWGQLPTNRYGTQDLVVIDTISVDSMQNPLNLVPRVVDYVLAYAGDSITFPGGAKYIVSDSLEAWIVDDSLSGLPNTRVRCGVLVSPAGESALALLSTSDLHVLKETAGLEDFVDLHLQRFYPSSLPTSDSGRISYIFCQLLPDTLNPCAEEDLEELELAAYRAQQGNYRIAANDSTHATRFSHVYWSGCNWGWIRWPWKCGVYWVHSGGHGVPVNTDGVTVSVGSLAGASGVSQSPVYDFNYGNILYWNWWGDFTSESVVYLWPRVALPAFYYAPCCQRCSSTGSYTKTCYCFEVRCVEEYPRSFPFDFVVRGWRYHGYVSLTDKSWNNGCDQLVFHVNVDHAIGIGADEFANPYVISQTYTYDACQFNPNTNLQFSMIGGGKKHSRHYDYVGVPLVHIQTDFSGRDFLKWKFCLDAEHRTKNLICGGATTDFEIAVRTPGPVLYTWAGPGGFTSNQDNPTLINVTPAMAGDYSVTVTPSNGCPYSETTTIEVVSSSSVNTGYVPSQSLYYLGDSITLSGLATVSPNTAIPPLGVWIADSLSWPQDTVTVSPTDTILYTYEIVNLEGACADVDSVVLVVYSDSCNLDTLHLSTGRDQSTEGVLDVPALDPHWYLISSPTQVTQLTQSDVIERNIPYWSPAMAGTQWVSSSPQGATNAPAGVYVYRRRFYLNHWHPSLEMQLRYLVDDTGTVIVNNQVVINRASDYVNPVQAPILNASYLMAGWNTIETHIRNTLNGPHGFDMEVILTGCEGLFNDTIVSSTPPYDAQDPFAQVAIYPNPTREFLHVRGISSPQRPRFTVVDLLGHNLIKTNSPDIDVRPLPVGVYILHIETREGNRVFRFSKH